MHDTATADQRLLLDASADLIADLCPMDAVRADRHLDTEWAVTYRRRTARLGWYSLLVPEKLGGGNVSGNGLVDATLIAHRRGRELQPGPFAAANAITHALATDDGHERGPDILAAVIAGEQGVSWAVGIPGVHAAHSGPHARRVGDGYELSGTTGLVVDADTADWILVTATSEEGLCQFLLPRATRGLTITPVESLDISRRFTEITFDRVAVTRADLLGAPGRCDDLVHRQLAIAAVLTAAEAVGAMERDLELTVRYAKDRIAFGRPIGSFQAIKHVLADMSLYLEMSIATVLAAAEDLGTGDSHGVLAASMAKAFVGDHGIDLAQNCFQVFGGIGFTWEHDQHRYLRRITTDCALFGDAAWHREHLCRLSGL
ncbi:acyl-CoA dehydrogenase family protein [Nocardia bovistercoris]|uniref:Acyl-CoA/acyl-ACP dehydrogenase n=1 Tax=Nocardia bovistercoris TaxID=2785916 RepID=A0A931IEQ5_9NOCA|nr:acyl-CoA dehydrogenase family protein [Nocardia bovistercoris]MBH0778435.1 acyl-CoA/acyl-ACP dehydrogenase [Nocardia bovistercoris]